MTLLRDIQNSAIDSKNSLSDLLRKCKILAARLHHAELDQWVENELNGYPSHDTLPKYRMIECSAIGNLGGPFGAEMRNITIPVSCLPEKARDWARRVLLVQPISSLEQLAQGEGDEIHCDWPGDLVASVADKIYHGYSLYGAWLRVSKGDVVAILDSVRNRILSFSLEIEKEAPNAGEAPPNTKPIPENKVTKVFNTYILGNVHNIATGSSNFSQSVQIAIGKGDFSSLKAFLKDNDVSEDDINLLEKAISKDKVSENQARIGKSVSGWISTMLKKAGTSAWKIANSSAGTLLTKAIAKYYGLE
ncbi:hypothetical protein Dvar_68100 [Desulfosarcina variabilis str. Montpellier]|uniref:AbiTii domain-containing protein n=1 Tax=Desulfosarcina variabilis TaxID=2300 RepID=UPI003AFB319D